ncbi:MAG: CBS domain-containing protein [Candidatus Thermoplasmatota archaeon]
MSNRLVTDFYNLKVKQLMDDKLWNIPIVEKKDDIYIVLNILSSRSHIWVVNDKNSNELVGVITEHDVLSTLAPKNLSPYVFGLPDIRSLQYGTVKTAEDIMVRKVITCKPDELIVDVLKRMTRYRLRRLPVIDNKRIVGEITLRRLIKKYYDATQYRSITEEG